jgi:hypothetical protein
MLTITAVQAAKARDRAYKLADGNGLYLLIETNGSKLWRLRYFFDSKEKMLSLGALPDVTIAQARTTLATGTDPARKREQDKLAADPAPASIR